MICKRDASKNPLHTRLIEFFWLVFNKDLRHSGITQMFVSFLPKTFYNAFYKHIHFRGGFVKFGLYSRKHITHS